MRRGGSIVGVEKARTRAEQKQHTRALIVASARRIVAESGFAGLAVREVARGAGIVPTAFYRHFASVDELAGALANGAATEFAALVDELVEAVRAPGGRLEHTAPPLAVRAAREDPTRWSVFARGLVDPAGPDHGALGAALDTAHGRVALALGRSERFAASPDAAVETAAELVVAELVRVLVETGAGHADLVAERSSARLGLVLAGLGA